jgi:hypothetical protein
VFGFDAPGCGKIAARESDGHRGQRMTGGSSSSSQLAVRM